jgi:hypothetical protein
MVEVLAETARTARETRAVPFLNCMVTAKGKTKRWGIIVIGDGWQRGFPCDERRFSTISNEIWRQAIAVASDDNENKVLTPFPLGTLFCTTNVRP